MIQNQGQMQKMQLPNQQIVLTPNQSPQHGMQMQSPQQQKPQPQSQQAVPGQAQFIRATRYVDDSEFNQKSILRQFIGENNSSS